VKQEGDMYKLRVKEILKEKNVSMGMLSRGANLHMNTVRLLVRDEDYDPNMSTILKVAKYLGVTLNDLYEEIDEKPGTN
jgi:DNA-binding Xre family transcriptional regulator